LQTKSGAKVVLGSLNRRDKILVVEARTEVERLAPSPLVEISDQVIEMVNHALITSLAISDTLLTSDLTNIITGARKHGVVVIHGGLELTLLQGVVRVIQNLHSRAITVIVLGVALHLSAADSHESSYQSHRTAASNHQRVLLRVVLHLIQRGSHLVAIHLLKTVHTRDPCSNISEECEGEGEGKYRYPEDNVRCVVRSGVVLGLTKTSQSLRVLIDSYLILILEQRLELILEA
jgi:hypothetical protein